ncbi:MAG: Ig-like domain-containing protein [Thermodesulfobacteriota bacterium]|jgi:hypothetical protein
MKKLAIIFSLIFVMILGLRATVMAQDEIQARITMYKYVSSTGESYSIKFEIFGQELKNVNKVSINVPSRRRLLVHNNLEFDGIQFSKDSMSYAEFRKRFPEGEYEINLTPRRYGRFKMGMAYNFPNPVITSPADGATDVPLNPTIRWEPLNNVNSLSLKAISANHTFSTDLPVDATSFTAGYDYLEPNTQYDLSLEATTIDFKGNALVSTYTISFTTIAK